MLTPAERERRKEALEWALKAGEHWVYFWKGSDEKLSQRYADRAATLREMLEELRGKEAGICHKCKGYGRLWAGLADATVPCPACHGKGEL